MAQQRRHFVIGSRKSDLAMTQTMHVKALLEVRGRVGGGRVGMRVCVRGGVRVSAPASHHPLWCGRLLTRALRSR